MVEMSCWSGSLSLHIPFISPSLIFWGSDRPNWPQWIWKQAMKLSFFFSFLLSFQVNKGSNNHVVYCDALRKTRGVSEAALACRYFLARTRRCSNFTEENETHTRDNREEFNSCKICDCSSSWEKWTEVNRNKMKYTAVITSVFSYP